MRAKFKLGTLVEFRNTNDEGDEIDANNHGVVCAIIQREQGFAYKMRDGEASETAEVWEKDILNAYKPMVARQAKTSKTRGAKAPKRSAKKTETAEARAEH